VTTGWAGAATTGAAATSGAGTKPDGAATDTATRQQATTANSDWKKIIVKYQSKFILFYFFTQV